MPTPRIAKPELTAEAVLRLRFGSCLTQVVRPGDALRQDAVARQCVDGDGHVLHVLFALLRRDDHFLERGRRLFGLCQDLRAGESVAAPNSAAYNFDSCEISCRILPLRHQ